MQQPGYAASQSGMSGYHDGSQIGGSQVGYQTDEYGNVYIDEQFGVQQQVINPVSTMPPQGYY